MPGIIFFPVSFMLECYTLYILNLQAFYINAGMNNYNINLWERSSDFMRISLQNILIKLCDSLEKGSYQAEH